MASLKEQKEAFVTGHSGTTLEEILLITASSPIGVGFYYCVLCLLTYLNGGSKAKLMTRGVVEFFFILLPMILCQTIFLYPIATSILLVQLLVTTIFMAVFRHPTSLSRPPRQQSISKKLPFLTIYRSSLYFHTFIAILAVDFHLFPRTLAKTETTGYGFMDLGATSFVISSGFVGPSKRSSILPLLALGLLRIVANKSTEYQEHVSEYGIHWNFFFTLTVVQAIASLSKSRTTNNNGIIPWVVLIFYQILLSVFHLQDYIEQASRTICPFPANIMFQKELCYFFAANREGILGCISYTSLNLISQTIGSYCLWSSSSSTLLQGKRLGACGAALWFLHVILTRVAEIPISRRSTNLTFVVWSLAHNVTLLFVFWLLFYIFATASNRTSEQQRLLPVILSAVNRHGLTMFVIANLLTGAVNLSVDTLAIDSDWLALIVIIGYVACIACIALALEGISENSSSSVKEE
mmetsp:Transcript_4546/g.6731  ORF Transcript_4546/g.6731 Transcript_4546/m.6731 type:complete len:466 (-) Transcript_4546:60-1457(-)